MNYLPFEDFEIHTKLTSDEVFYKLRASVDTERKLQIFTNKVFWGEVSRSEFKFWRAIWWNRSSPVIFGKIWTEESGCCIVVRMRLPWLGFLFDVLFFGWFCVIYFGVIAKIFIQKIQTGSWQIDSPLMLLLFPCIFIFIYLISSGPFKSEVRHITNYLLTLSQTQKENIVYRDEFLGLKESQIIRVFFVITIIISLLWVMLDILR